MLLCALAVDGNPLVGTTIVPPSSPQLAFSVFCVLSVDLSSTLLDDWYGKSWPLSLEHPVREIAANNASHSSPLPVSPFPPLFFGVDSLGAVKLLRRTYYSRLHLAD